MKAQLFAALLAVAGCATPSAPNDPTTVTPARGEFLTDQNTVGTDPVAGQTEKAGTTTTTAAETKSTASAERGERGMRSEGDVGGAVHVPASRAFAPPMLPPPTPRPVNTGDPCGWCR
jgi:hypothetical protein